MPVEANILTAQSAQDEGVGVSALGMGWQIRPPDPIPWAVVVVVSVPRDRIGTEVVVSVKLETADGGEPVEGAPGSPVQFEWRYEPAGLTDQGLKSPIVEGLAFNLLPVPLEPGREFVFRLWVDGETRDHWAAHFRTMLESESE